MMSWHQARSSEEESMAGRLDGKTALVTGGASGMGRAGATAFAREGASVVISDIDEPRAEAVARAIVSDGGRASVLPFDVTDSASVESMTRAATDQLGRIDVLYHCAVDVHFVNYEDRRLTELDDAVWDRMLRLCLTGAFYLCKHVGRQMLAQRSGSIILSATTDALIGVAGLDSYTAAKGGIVSLTRSFAAGMAPDGVRVNTLCPAFVSTEPQMDWLDVPESRAAIQSLHLLPIPEPEDIAPFAVFLASDESRSVTGGIFPVDSGYMAFKAHVDTMGAMQRGRPETAS
jgi:NAD(P)-dependent dehydrogenase (short-subunit alcohol dehydrogenase family)